MILIVENSLIKAKELDGLEYSNPTLTRIKTVRGGFLGLFPVQEEEEYMLYQLKLAYTNTSGEKKIWSCSSEEKSGIDKLAKDIIEQIKCQDPDFVNLDLEKAIINGGTS